MDLQRGELLAIAGVALFATTMVGSAVAAPNIGATDGSDGRTLVGVHGGGPGWHKFGKVTMYDGSSVAWSEGSADSYFDVTMLDDGSVLAGFMHSGYQDCGPYESPCSRTGFRVIDPAGPSVADEFGFPVRTSKNSEVHDVEKLGPDRYVLTDMDRERIFIVEDGETVWEWTADPFYDAPEDPTATDWLHINDVDVIDEGRFLVSVRNANQLVVVQRGEGVVEVVNEDTEDGNDDRCRGKLTDTDGDGDIRCGDPDVMNRQHNPQWLGGGAVLVADSHNDRAVELHKEGGEWTPAWSLSSANDIALNWPRDADRLPNGNTLITDTLNRRIVEVDQDGNVVWSIRTDKIPYEADRLPAGEPVGAPVYENGQVTAPGDDVPVLTTALVGLRAVYPGLPFWFTELQLGATVLSLGLVVGGAVDRRRSDDADGDGEVADDAADDAEAADDADGDEDAADDGSATATAGDEDAADDD